MRILLTGKNGQVGWELQRALAGLGELSATDRAQLDLADPAQVRRVVREARPDIIVNAAAYTAVDHAESDEAAAMAVNRDGPAVLAEEAGQRGALLVHFSTDYVFDGEKSSPYVESDKPNPLNAYGRSKLAGEQAVQASGCHHLILRTSWVYAGRGRNFFLTILKAAREKPELRVVDDQFGAPTSAPAIAQAVAQALQANAEGLYHMTAGGKTSWFGFAQSIVRGAGLATAVLPIASSQYATKARRPRNSVLDNTRLKKAFGVSLPEWQSQLEQVMRQP